MPERKDFASGLTATAAVKGTVVWTLVQASNNPASGAFMQPDNNSGEVDCKTTLRILAPQSTMQN